jgi:hypothetical protein
LKDCESAGAIRRDRSDEVGLDVACLDVHAGEDAAARVDDRAIDHARGDLRLG